MTDFKPSEVFGENGLFARMYRDREAWLKRFAIDMPSSHRDDSSVNQARARAVKAMLRLLDSPPAVVPFTVLHTLTGHSDGVIGSVFAELEKTLKKRLQKRKLANDDLASGIRPRSLAVRQSEINRVRDLTRMLIDVESDLREYTVTLATLPVAHLDDIPTPLSIREAVFAFLDLASLDELASPESFLEWKDSIYLDPVVSRSIHKSAKTYQPESREKRNQLVVATESALVTKGISNCELWLAKQGQVSKRQTKGNPIAGMKQKGQPIVDSRGILLTHLPKEMKRRNAAIINAAKNGHDTIPPPRSLRVRNIDDIPDRDSMVPLDRAAEAEFREGHDLAYQNVRLAFAGLSDDEKLVLAMQLEGTAAEIIARKMRWSLSDTRQIMETAYQKLRQRISSLPAPEVPFSKDEREAFKLYAGGESCKEIASQIGKTIQATHEVIDGAMKKWVYRIDSGHTSANSKTGPCTEGEWNAFRLRCQGLTASEAAEALGCTVEDYSGLLGSALRKLSQNC